jgi:cytochrome b561
MTDTSATPPTTPTERAVHARHGYSSTQIALHWSVVGLVTVNWLIGGAMEEVFERREAGEAIVQWGPAFVHIALGLAIFGTMVARVLARINRPVETAAGTKHPIMALLGMINHWAFYAVLLAMPPLGAIAWFGGAEWAGDLHGLLAFLLPILIVVHVGGALVHLVLGENIIRRIVRPTAGT